MKNEFLNNEIPGGMFSNSDQSNKYTDLLQSQLKTAKDNEFLMLCAGCEKEFKMMHLYRCFYCGLWFCPACSKKHYKKGN